MNYPISIGLLITLLNGYSVKVVIYYFFWGRLFNPYCQVIKACRHDSLFFSSFSVPESLVNLKGDGNFDYEELPA